MRLLNTHTFRLENLDFDVGQTQYALLSHTWTKKEPLLEDVERFGCREDVDEYGKLAKSCYIASQESLDYVWVDSCCVDRRNAPEVEMTEIRMYHWFEQAALVIVHLSDVDSLDHQEFEHSRWFMRSWTLQELVAPRGIVRFFSRNWEYLGSRSNLSERISSITGIPTNVLTGHKLHSDYSIAQRMSWASRRFCTAPEDAAYSLMGLFDVEVPLLRGIGAEKAFLRLQEEIIKKSPDESIFAWKSRNLKSSGLLAPSLDCFRESGDVAFDGSSGPVPRFSMTKNSSFLQFAIGSLGADLKLSIVKDFKLTLNCYMKVDGKSLRWVQTRLVKDDGGFWYRDKCEDWDLTSKFKGAKSRLGQHGLRYLNVAANLRVPWHDLERDSAVANVPLVLHSVHATQSSRKHTCPTKAQPVPAKQERISGQYAERKDEETPISGSKFTAQGMHNNSEECVQENLASGWSHDDMPMDMSEDDPNLADSKHGKGTSTLPRRLSNNTTLSSEIESISEQTTRTDVARAFLYGYCCLFDHIVDTQNFPGTMTDEDRWFQDYRKTILTRLRRRKKSIDRVKVAILDSGIDLDNDFIPDSKRLKAALSFVDGSDKMETTDTCRHGTAVAALIKKTAPHADVYVARITSDGNSLRQNSLVAAFDHALEQWQVDIIVMSFGYSNWWDYPLFQRAIRKSYGRDKPVLLFAAASNSGGNQDCTYPARFDHVFCINSCDGNGNKSSFTPNPTTGKKAYSILGEGIFAAQASSRISGTSYATPIAAGLAASLIEFAKQSWPEDGDEVERKRLFEHLHTDAGMASLFDRIAEPRDSYYYLCPWRNLFDVDGMRENSQLLDQLRWELKK